MRKTFPPTKFFTLFKKLHRKLPKADQKSAFGSAFVFGVIVGVGVIRAILQNVSDVVRTRKIAEILPFSGKQTFVIVVILCGMSEL